MSGFRVVLVATLVIFAGCSAFGSPDGTIDRDPYTVNETVDPTPDEPIQLVPGLTTDGINDSAALVDAHAATLDNASYVINQEYTITYSNGTVAHHVQGETRVAAGGFPQHVRSNESSLLTNRPPREIEQWRTKNETLLYINVTGSAPEYQKFNGTMNPPHETRMITTILETATNVSVGRDRTDDSRYIITGNFTWHDQDAEFSMAIHEDGYVEAYYLETDHMIEIGVESGKQTQYVTFDHINSSNLAINKPAWYDNATANTTESL